MYTSVASRTPSRTGTMTFFSINMVAMDVPFFGPSPGLILLVANLLHPVDGLAVEPLLNGNVRHGGGCRGAVPVLLARREPDHVARPDFLDRAAPALRQAAAGGHDQGLAQRVGVPRR